MCLKLWFLLHKQKRISKLYVQIEGGHHKADIGGTIYIEADEEVNVSIRFKDPTDTNSWEQNPEVTRVDLIMGEITGPVIDRDADTNPTTNVIARFSSDDWQTDGEYRVINYTILEVNMDSYIRFRGTNSMELEPEKNPLGESPWTELWFYSNPIFIEMEQ